MRSATLQLDRKCCIYAVSRLFEAD